MTGIETGTAVVVDDWSAVEAVGADASKFLNSFCTNDVSKLEEGGACEALFTDVKAHAVAQAWVARVADEGFLALISSDRAEALHTHLDRYLIREKVELTVVPPGPWTLRSAEVTDASFPAGAVRLACFGEKVFAVRGDQSDGAQLLSSVDFERFRIARGVPLDGIDVDHRNLPQELDRNDQLISFTKGCYLGQEPVARIDALGRVNWLLRGVQIDGPAPDAAAEILVDGKSVGRVTSSVSTDTGSIALAYVRREHAKEGQPAQVDGTAVTIRTLPMGD